LAFVSFRNLSERLFGLLAVGEVITVQQHPSNARAIVGIVLDDQNVDRRFLLSSPGTLYDEEGR
jgi:hypothetical protein